MKCTTKKHAILTVLLITTLFMSLTSVFVLKDIEGTPDNIQTNADSHTKNNFPDENTGGATVLYVFSYGQTIHHAWLKFDLSSLPSSAYITDAKLYLYAYTVTEGGTISCHVGDSDSWTEMGITWNNQPSYGSAVDYEAVTVGYTWENWDVTSSVRTAFEDDQTISFVMIPEDQLDLWFRSRSGGQIPYLSITYEYYPTNDALTLEDADIGSQGCLAQYKSYTFRAKVSDLDGGTNLTYVEIRLDPTDENLRYRWTESTDTFSEELDPNGYAEITSDGADSTLAGNQWTLDFEIKFDWDYPDEVLSDVQVYSLDDDSHSDTDTYSNIYYVENDLAIYNLDETDNRINPSGTIYLSGSLAYQGTSYIDPPNGNYHVNATLGSQPAVVKGSDTTLVNGDFNITVTGESTVDAYVYKCEADYQTATQDWAIVIVDQIEMNVTANDYYANVNQTVTFTVTGKYKYDGLPCSGLLFDVARNGTYNTSSTPFYDMRNSSGTWNYTVSNANETQYDLTSFTSDLIWVAWGFWYNFYGVYDEDTGLLLDPSERAVNITAYWSETVTETFELNGTLSKGYGTRPLLFEFHLNKTREYWLSPGDASFNFYVFEDDTEYYTIEFLDLAGILDTYQYISARRLVNGTYMTVEKRMVDEENKVVMALGYMERYNIVLGDTVEYTYGDVEFGLLTTITLTIRGLDFPREVTVIYRYVRIYGERGFNPSGTGNITITYEDTLEETNSITLYFKYLNGTIAHTYATATSSLVYTWSNALNNTAYNVEAIYYHDTFGTQTWKQYFPRGYSSNKISLNWLGSLGFDTSIIIPALIIIFVAVCFSVLNAYLGAFLTVVVAIILTWMGMILIPPSALVTAFALSIMMGIVYMKRKVRVG